MLKEQMTPHTPPPSWPSQYIQIKTVPLPPFVEGPFPSLQFSILLAFISGYTRNKVKNLRVLLLI